jgi:uncharacterized glyoxalase superfamily metalloenzyme YdcJ
MPHDLAEPLDMQNRLFAELSRMFASEVPMYDKSLLANAVCNRVVCDVLALLHPGLEITDAQLERASGERHGAIRIGRPDEYRWIARYFAQFGMEPHRFYDMSTIGARSQPVIATAFRSVLNPEHRVFTSLLLTDFFDAPTRARIERVLAGRQVFSDRAMRLVEKAERQGGLDWADANALIREGTERIFKWTGTARDHALYSDLCASGFKIAADIACFDRHHLNHLTPNTLCMDLYVATMKHAMGEIGEDEFRARATRALAGLVERADRDFLRLSFRHLSAERIAGFGAGAVGEAEIAGRVAALAARVRQPDLDLRALPHSGFKDFTEGPSADTPIFLRQDAYRALSEQVTFTNADGTRTVDTHTARFGEIEQRFYAATPAGRALYDRCLEAAEAERGADPALARRDFAAHEARYARHFEPIPKRLPALLEAGLVHGLYAPTPSGLAMRGAIGTTDLRELVAAGLVRAEGLRYEDFLPVSAAGIFASNLNQYGTASTAPVRSVHTRETLEEIMGRPIVDAEAVYRGLEARSILETFTALGLLERLPAARVRELEAAAAALPPAARTARPGLGAAPALA